MHPHSFFAFTAAAAASFAAAKNSALDASFPSSSSPRKVKPAFDAFAPFFASSLADVDASTAMPPPYTAASEPTAQSSALALPPSPILCPPSPTPSMSLFSASSSPNLSSRRGPPAPISPPPYSAPPPLHSPTSVRSTAPAPHPLSPRSLEIDDQSLSDPHYLATPTQRSYFVHLSDLFEEAAVKEGLGAKVRRMSVQALPVLRRNSAPKGEKGEKDEEPQPGCLGCCTIC
ncbi:hypothetical protein JCM8097_009282 [Rhodosporidiobolus ruineniae]